MIPLLLVAMLDTPSCTDKLSSIERSLSVWSKGPRSISALGEVHRYHAVSKRGRTYHMTIIEVPEDQVKWSEYGGYQMIGVCLRNAEGKAILFKTTIKD